jgi:alpha-N-arabinofuranosidase
MVHRSLLVCSALLVSLVPCAAGAGGVVRIDAGRQAPYRISPNIYGSFLEPIDISIYGGIWAQLLANPSLEDGLWSVRAVEQLVRENPALRDASKVGLPLPWEPLAQKQGARYEPRWGDAANSLRSLLLMALPGTAETGIRQRIYLPIHRIASYEGRVYLKLVSGPGRVTVSLRRRNHPEQVLASQTLELTGADWKAYPYKLNLAAGAVQPLEAVDYAVSAANETRVLVDQALLFPADHQNGLDPELVAMARALATPILRYGGNFTSGYHWRDGIGPVDQRANMLNLAWGIPEYNHFGTEEYLQLCRLIHAQPQICLNLGSGTPEEAAEWVRFVNERWNQGRGGLSWELGNELWGGFQTGYPTLARVAERTRDFAEAVRRVDPKARLIATGQDPDHFREWNAAQLGLAPGTFEMLSTHFVVGSGAVKKPQAGEDFIALAAHAMPVALERRLRLMKEQIDTTAHRGRVEVAFTEWLFHGPETRGPGYHTLGGAICAAGMFHTFFRTGDFLTLADMTGLIQFGGIWKRRERAYAVPAYYAFQFYSTSGAVQPVAVENTTETYDVAEGNGRTPEIAGVPYVDIVAALNETGDRLTLFCINRDPEHDRPTRIELDGFRPASPGRVRTLTSSSISAYNSEEHPTAVVPVESSFRMDSRACTYPFQKSSVTVIELRR